MGQTEEQLWKTCPMFQDCDCDHISLSYRGLNSMDSTSSDSNFSTCSLLYCSSNSLNITRKPKSQKVTLHIYIYIYIYRFIKEIKMWSRFDNIKHNMITRHRYDTKKIIKKYDTIRIHESVKII